MSVSPMALFMAFFVLSLSIQATHKTDPEIGSQGAWQALMLAASLGFFSEITGREFFREIATGFMLGAIGHLLWYIAHPLVGFMDSTRAYTPTPDPFDCIEANEPPAQDGRLDASAIER